MTLPFDLVILDLDGTILDLYHAQGISAAVRETIGAVQAAGIPVTIGTGRTLDYIRQHVAGPLQLRTPAVTTQGAVIGDPATGHIWREITIPLEAARRVAEWVERARQITVFYFNEPDGQLRLYQNFPADDPLDHAFHEHVFGAPRILMPSLLTRLSGPHAHPPLKFLIDNDLARGDDLAPILRAEFGDQLYITRTHPRLVEGTAPGVDKGAGARALCEMLGIDPQRVLAIGDNDNDIPLLQAVGYGVAMGNATPGAKTVAHWVAPPIEQDGAAVALRTLVLEQINHR